MQLFELTLGGDLEELINHGTALFPCAAYDEDFDKFVSGDVPWHWHDEIELVVSYEGSTFVECGQASFTVAENEGAFINSNVLHTLRVAGHKGCKILSILFHPSLLSGAPQSIYEQKYVKPIISCCSLQGFLLSPGVPWQKNALEAIVEAHRKCEEKGFGYELLVRENLSRAWYQLALNTQNIISENRRINNQEETEIKKMLTLIHENYAEAIDVRKIAAAASVSESECYRCFKKVIGFSPLDYLLRYRVSISAGLLRETNKPITEISLASGFNSPSYFAKVFKQHFNCTPRSYRLQQLSEV